MKKLYAILMAEDICMKIGIDLDGTILNSEASLKFYADYYSYFCLNGKIRKRDDIVSQENCFDWTEEEEDKFFNNIFDKASRDCDLIVGAKQIIKMLKEERHELYIISLRGYYRDEELPVGEKAIKKLGVDFDGVIWKVKDKFAKCKELGIDVFIDNDSKYVKEFKNSKINVIYLRDGYTEEVKGKNIFEAQTWVDVYRAVKSLQIKRS